MKHSDIPYHWLDAITHTRHAGWCYQGIRSGKELEPTLVQPAEELKQHLYYRTPWQEQLDEGFFITVDIPDIARGQRLINPRPVIRSLIPGLKSTGKHALYRFDIDGEIYVFPALFFIAWLYLRRRALAHYLFMPGMLESHLDPSPELKDEEIIMRVGPSFNRKWLTGDNARFMAWLALHADVRRAWGSVAEHALRGEIDLALPHASMQGRVGGIKVAGLNFIGWSREMTFDYGFPQKNIRMIQGSRQVALKAR